MVLTVNRALVIFRASRLIPSGMLSPSPPISLWTLFYKRWVRRGLSADSPDHSTHNHPALDLIRNIMEPSDTKRQPPTYREITPPPPYPNVPSPEYLNEMFRYFYLRKSRDNCTDTLTDFLAKNKEYKLELYYNDERLRIILPDACYMSMEVEELRKMRKRLEVAVIKGKILLYWELDVARNYEAKRELMEAKLRNDYQKRLEQDEEFRRMEATKSASVISAELKLRVHHSISHW